MTLRGTLFIISAPSGGGKTSLVNALIKQLPNITVSISHTTRAHRLGEIDGKDYFFVDEKTFTQYREEGLFLEHAQVFDHWYGTSKKWVMDELDRGRDVILEIDWQGARKVRELMDCVSIFIVPPSTAALHDRLKNRMQDSPQIIETRMAQAKDEISHYAEYDFLIVNQIFELALGDLEAIVRANRLLIKNQKARYSLVLATMVG